uniref:Uncharacterized protein n=1 Tax=Ciona savignyi TaxID=51511 RepID=H2YKI1_CIOSA
TKNNLLNFLRQRLFIEVCIFESHLIRVCVHLMPSLACTLPALHAAPLGAAHE